MPGRPERAVRVDSSIWATIIVRKPSTQKLLPSTRRSGSSTLVRRPAESIRYSRTPAGHPEGPDGRYGPRLAVGQGGDGGVLAPHGKAERSRRPVGPLSQGGDGGVLVPHGKAERSNRPVGPLSEGRRWPAVYRRHEWPPRSGPETRRSGLKIMSGRNGGASPRGVSASAEGR